MLVIIEEQSGDVLCSPIKAVSVLVPVILGPPENSGFGPQAILGVCQEEGQVSACKESFCCLDTPRALTYSDDLARAIFFDCISILEVNSYTLTANLYVSLAIQTVAL
ncbi:hypothetical protein TNCV_1258461 [Trichonephila clavipes]|nr:hypothetical protein TNCV_1258461 [Trichonephila clavipes]